jgi:hypothetical protein
MPPLPFAIAAGLSFGVVDVLLMIPLALPDKRTAMLGAFLSRFAIGFLIPFVKLPLAPWLAGGLVGLLISLPDAAITRSYAPILVGGVVGGILVGWASGAWVV